MSDAPENSEGSGEARVQCWRCAKWIPAWSTVCPICRARAKHEVAPAPVAEIGPDDVEASPPAVAPVVPELVTDASAMGVLKFFAVMLAISLVHFLIAQAVVREVHNERRAQATLRSLTSVVEAIDAVLVIIAVVMVTRPPTIPREGEPSKWLGWLAGIPLLAVALALNAAYHHILNRLIRVPDWLVDQQVDVDASILWLVVAVCVQPAIVEELFFRYLSLGHLRKLMGTHAAVWLSSLMFGLAHLGVPLSIPILIVVGIAFGYARVWSGSMLLPMLMHAIHNGVIVYWERNP